MNEPKFTKGPWNVDTGDPYLITADCDGLMVAETDNADRKDDVEAEANARLIAAAPEMHEALRFVSEKCQLYGAADAARAKIEAALAKATTA